MQQKNFARSPAGGHWKIVTGRDISNIRAKLNTSSSKNNIEALIEKLQQNEGSNYIVLLFITKTINLWITMLLSSLNCENITVV